MLQVLKATAKNISHLKEKKKQVTDRRDSLLKGTEGPLRRPDPPLREACCPPGALVKDGSESFSPDTALRLLSITDFSGAQQRSSNKSEGNQ